MTRGFVALVLGTGIVASPMMARMAHAERAPLTDFQASRLTLDALTAAPVVRRVSYHAASSSHGRASRHGVVAHAISTHAHAQVRNVVYSTHTAHAAHGAKKVRHRT